MEELFLFLSCQNADAATTLEKSLNYKHITTAEVTTKKLFLFLSQQNADTAAALQKNSNS